MGAERPTGLDLVAAATAFLLPVAYLPIVDAPFWSPKVAVLLPAAAVGLTCIPALLRTELRRATLAALVFLLVASLSAASSDDVSQAVFGLYNWGTGLLFIWCLVGVWALGASVTEAGRKRVVLGLVTGIGISAAVGVLQVVVDLGVPFLGSPVDDRATGFAGNPVHLAALALGVVAMAAAKVDERWWWLVAVGAGAMVIQLAGSRFALLLLPLLVVALLAWRGWRQAAAVLACLVIGLGVGSGVAGLGEAQTSSTDRVTALSASGGGVTARLETWLSARHAIADRPLFGEGPGRFRAATSPHRTLKLARAEGPDRVFEDAHNLVVEYAVTTGLLGVVGFAGWLWLAVAKVRVVILAVFAAALLALHVVQPQSLGTTPLALLALGASTRASFSAPLPVQRRRAMVPLIAGALAMLSGAVLLIGDAQLQRARLDFDEPASKRSVRLLAPWPNPATVRARMFSFQALEEPDGAAVEKALRWRREAVKRAPDAGALWNQLAQDQVASRHVDEALNSYRQALAMDPWSLRALRGLEQLGEGDERLERLIARR